MFKSSVNVSFDDLLTEYKTVIQYISDSSDSFSVISNLQRPYSQVPPNFRHNEIMKTFEPFLAQYLVGIKHWPGTITKDNHKVMIIYRSCNESRKLLNKMPNFFLPTENGLPEDICFYRNQDPWFVTISHERSAFITNATKEDIAFFKENGIQIFD